MVNRGRSRVTGQFVNRRVQNVQQLADLPDHEWELDDEAMVILEGGIARAVQDGWIPPVVAVPASNPDWDEAHVQPIGDAGPDRDSDRDPWLDALNGEATS